MTSKFWWLILVVWALCACDDGGDTMPESAVLGCSLDSDCASGTRCVEGNCIVSLSNECTSLVCQNGGTCAVNGYSIFCLLEDQ